MKTLIATYTLSIEETADSMEELAQMLREMADKIDQGYTSGYYPTFDIVRSEEEVEE